MKSRSFTQEEVAEALARSGVPLSATKAVEHAFWNHGIETKRQARQQEKEISRRTLAMDKARVASGRKVIAKYLQPFNVPQ